MGFENTDKAKSYWNENLKLVFSLLFVWFIVSYLFGILFVSELNQIHFMGFKLGFWFAQQGAMYVFVLLIFIYAAKANKLDEKYDVHEN